MNNSSEEILHLALGEVLDISTSGELKASLVNALGSDAQVVLEADSIEKADTAALQLLSAFVNDAKAKGLAVQWRQPSAVLLRSAELLGLTEFLGLSELAA